MLRLEDAAEPSEGTDSTDRVRTIRHAIDRGVNYINLGFPLYFKNPKKACEQVKDALGDGYRDKVKVAVNISSREIASQQDLDDALADQLRLFEIDKADFCMIDGVYRATWNNLKSIDIASWATRTIASGKVAHIGLNFHDDAHYLKNIIDTYPQWAVIQIEFSMLDYKHHPGVGAFKFAEKHGIAVIASDITKSGRLLKNIPESAQTVLDNSSLNLTREERCIRWTLGFKEIASALMSAQAEFNSTEHVEKYLSYINHFAPNDVDIWERLDATRIREAYYKYRDCLCTACRCCMPCPIGIDVPRIIELINDEKMFANSRIPKFQYISENHHEIKCTQCGICDKQCPRRFPLHLIVDLAEKRYST